MDQEVSSGGGELLRVRAHPPQHYSEEENLVHFHCTVSGGLELAAFVELRALGFVDQQLNWKHRGQSGSQLGISCSPQNVPKLMELRLVEYVYLDVLSLEIEVASSASSDRILRTIQEIVARNWKNLQSQKNVVEGAMNICRECQTGIGRTCNIGLESLPGCLIPTPDVVEGSGADQSRQKYERGFIVNTIYTESKVAKAVANLFVALAKRYLPNDKRGDDIFWIDAGAGSGALLQHLPAPKVGFDIYPGAPLVQKMDFLKLSIDLLRDSFSESPKDDGIDPIYAVISNPPFAEGSRGDYRAIVKFINHALITLGGMFMGVIVPANFARERVWKSLGLDHRVRLLSRFLLPSDSFYDPSSGSIRHIKSYFLFFGGPQIGNSVDVKDTKSLKQSIDDNKAVPKHNSLYIIGKRDKGDCPWLSKTADFTGSITSALHSAGADLGLEAHSEFQLHTKLSKSGSGSPSDANVNSKLQTLRAEFSLLVNPKQPLSLINCASKNVENHSLGWLSTSVKPPLAYTMFKVAGDKKWLQDILFQSETTSATNKKSPAKRVVKKRGHLMVNTICGEGTIELESTNDQGRPFFIIAGDVSEEAAISTAERLKTLTATRSKQSNHTPVLIDLIIWDAQRLPLRSGVVDVLLGDLPFSGSTKKVHQVPTSSPSPEKSPSLSKNHKKALDYRRVMAESVRVLQSGGGRAALVSADAKALSHAVGKYNDRWSVLWRSNVNIGGLGGKLFLMERKPQSSKDLSLWVSSTKEAVDAGCDLSSQIYNVAVNACSRFQMGDYLELNDVGDCPSKQSLKITESLIAGVEFSSQFYHEEKQLLSHCYRVWFRACVSNPQAKVMEKHMRLAVSNILPEGFQLR